MAISKGSKVEFEGVKYVVYCEPTAVNGKIILTIMPDLSDDVTGENSADQLLLKLAKTQVLKEKATLIVQWFNDQRISQGRTASTNQSNTQKSVREIMKLFHRDEDEFTIIKVLQYIFEDAFWDDVITSLVSIATPTGNDGVTKYEKVKDKMIAKVKRESKPTKSFGQPLEALVDETGFRAK